MSSGDKTGPNPELIGELGEWEVTLVSGDVISVLAHAYEQVEGAYLFSAFAEGQPVVELPLVRIPSKLVTRVLGG